MAALARALGGGALVGALAVLLYTVAASFGGWLAGEPSQVTIRLTSAWIYVELVAILLASAAALLAISAFGPGHAERRTRPRLGRGARTPFVGRGDRDDASRPAHPADPRSVAAGVPGEVRKEA